MIRPSIRRSPTTSTRLAAADPAVAGRRPPHRSGAPTRAQLLPIDRAKHLWRYTDAGSKSDSRRAERSLGTPGRRLRRPAGGLSPTPRSSTSAGLTVEVRDGKRAAHRPRSRPSPNGGVIVAELRAAAAARTRTLVKRAPVLDARHVRRTSDKPATPTSRPRCSPAARSCTSRAVSSFCDRPLKRRRTAWAGDGVLVVAHAHHVIGESAEAELVIDRSRRSTEKRGRRCCLHETIEVRARPEREAARLVTVQSARAQGSVHVPLIQSAAIARDASPRDRDRRPGWCGLVKSLQTAALEGKPARSSRVLGHGVRRRAAARRPQHLPGPRPRATTSSDLDFRTVSRRSRPLGLHRLPAHRSRGGGLPRPTSRNHNLLLSHDTARADSIPELEILTNDVVVLARGHRRPDRSRGHALLLRPAAVSRRGRPPASLIVAWASWSPPSRCIPADDIREERVRTALARPVWRR